MSKHKNENVSQKIMCIIIEYSLCIKIQASSDNVIHTLLMNLRFRIHCLYEQENKFQYFEPAWLFISLPTKNNKKKK
jgi:hypothetical protein